MAIYMYKTLFEMQDYVHVDSVPGVLEYRTLCIHDTYSVCKYDRILVFIHLNIELYKCVPCVQCITYLYIVQVQVRVHVHDTNIYM